MYAYICIQVHINNCQHHCQTGESHFNGDTVDGQIISDQVVAWYKAAIKLDGSQEDLPRKIDRCDVEPCGDDICCANCS